MGYRQALDELFKLEFFGMKLGLENIRELLHTLGDPQDKLKSIHVAGTNGKGSVCAMLAAVLQSQGYTVGLFTSPHLTDYRERIRINGEMIPESELLEYVELVWPTVLRIKATFFEVATAMAFWHFQKHGVDYAIIETGLGGRLDSTNVLHSPVATVISSIGWDHMEKLGDTLAEIAREKAGIFKSGVPAIANVSQPQLREVFEEVADKVRAQILFVQVERAESYAVAASLKGAHQITNLATVLTTLEAIGRFDDVSFREGVSQVSELTGLRARLEIYRNEALSRMGKVLYLDVGHNVDAIQQVARHFRQTKLRPVVVLGLMRDKAIDDILNVVGGFAERVVAVAAPGSRSLPAVELASRGAALGLRIAPAGSVVDGVIAGLDQGSELVLLTGSHYVVGDFLANATRLERVILAEAHPAQLSSSYPSGATGAEC